MRLRVGSVADLRVAGRILTKVGSHGVCVFWHDERPYALDDRCPHMGFPLHRGTVEDGLVTCHWHHARFDLVSGGTLDPFADDARSYPVEVEDGDVFVVATDVDPGTERLRHRLVEGLESGLTLVIAKSVIRLLEDGTDSGEIVRIGVEFGVANRREGWGSGLTVLVAMANLLPRLEVRDRPLALVHGLAFLARDTRNHAPRFPTAPLEEVESLSRLAGWYRRFVETRAGAAAERVLVSALANGAGPEEVGPMMMAAATDHVFLDGGHVLDFTNKAFEALDLLGWDSSGPVLATLVDQTAGASRAEEAGRWRHPDDLAALVWRAHERLPAALAEGAAGSHRFGDAADLARRMLVDDPELVVDEVLGAAADGAAPEELARALALAAALRITRFHVQNDLGDWDSVHHAFTFANAVHQCARRWPGPEVVRAVVHGALRVYLDRFLNVPAARLPSSRSGDLSELQACWDTQGQVEVAGAIVYGYLQAGGDADEVVAALGHALLSEDAGFHWYQVVEAAARQAGAWPSGSEEEALILTGAARFLAAHTPTRRELAQVVRTATRLCRGEDVFEEE